MSPTQDLYISLAALLICAVIAFFGIRNNFAEKKNIRIYRPPWMVFALAAISVGFMVLVHIANLLGFETGNR